MKKYRHSEIHRKVKLVCTKCVKEFELRSDLPVSAESVEEKTGFQIVGVRFEYLGYCSHCTVKKRS
jgi:Fe2+ or Zn2+ uptake regulation protein